MQAMQKKLYLGLAIAVATASLSQTAHAFRLDMGSDDFALTVDTTLRYNLGVRVDGRDSRIASTATADEGTYKFDRNDVVNNRLDILTEVEGVWKGTSGFRVSAAGWYDDAYKNTDVETNPDLPGESSYYGDSYSSHTKRFYRGPSGEILDAFLFTNFNLGSKPVNLKVGSHTIYWGAALFSQGGISYSQHAIDGRKSAASPGTETRELFRPLNQISFQSQLTNSLSIAGQYYLDWEPIAAPEGGTFLAGTDFVLEGPDQTGAGLPFLRGSMYDPSSKQGNWGISAKYMLMSFNASTISAYYREFDEKNGFWLTLNPDNPLEYRAAFARNTKLAGISLDTTVGPVSVGAELSKRMDAGLATVGFAQTNEGARGDVWHALVNGIYGIPRTAFWDSAVLSAEVTYDRLDKVTKNEALFNRAGGPNCPLGKSVGCATKDAWGIGISFKAEYPQVFPGIDLSIPITYQAGIEGNTPDFGGTSERAQSYSIGAEINYRRKWSALLTYADSSAKIVETAPGVYSGAGSWQTTDRARVNLTLKTSF